MLKSAKSLFASKTFWTNLAIGAATLAGFIPTSKAAVVAATALNIGLRIATNKPIKLLKDSQ